MTSPSRIAAGVPTGGQFAAAAHTEADVDLSNAFTAPALTPWYAAKFDEDDQAEWGRYTSDPVVASAWREAGFEPDDYAAMLMQFGDDEHAAPWRDAGLDAETAIDLNDHGVATAAEGAGWRDTFAHLPEPDRAYLGTIAEDWRYDFGTPDQARPWVDAFDAKSALAWDNHGFDPESATAWRDAHFDPEAADQWRFHGFAPAGAAAWRRRGFDGVTAAREEEHLVASGRHDRLPQTGTTSVRAATPSGT